MKFNFHTHSTFSDGKNTIEEIVKSAIDNDFDILGISDHGFSPIIPQWNDRENLLKKYFDEIERVKSIYSSKIKIYKGVEAEYIQGIIDINFYRNLGFDYVIGGLHYFPLQFEDGIYFNFDTTENLFIRGLEKFFNNDIKKLVTTYYDHLYNMIETSPPDILAHLDVITKFNLNFKYFNETESWYTKLIDHALEIISKKNVIVEVNARRKYKNYHHDYSPNSMILDKILQKDIPITISGDVHQANEISIFWDSTINHLKFLGFREIYYFYEGKWLIFNI